MVGMKMQFTGIIYKLLVTFMDLTISFLKKLGT